LNSLHRIKVLGRELQVRSTASPEQVRQIESYVNATIAEIEASTRIKDQQVVTILALLNIAESYMEMTWKSSESGREDNDRLSRMLHRVEDALK
jgi:cell division protein ZapA